MTVQQLSLFPTQTFSNHHDWITWLNHILRPQPPTPHSLKVFDLFAGCGGLAVGFEAIGFVTEGFELKPTAAETYNQNLFGTCHTQCLQVGIPEGNADIIIGGPPCQPFSQIGYQRGKRDLRDGFPIFLDAIRRIQPKIAILENVRGLLFRNKDYLRLVVQELESFGYNVYFKLIKAVDYGVPQKRERVFVIASQVGWEWPDPMVDIPVTVETALGGSEKQASPDSVFLTPSMDRYIAKYEKRSHCVRPRDLHLDLPARTLTCRNLAGATGDMLRIRLPDGRRRMLSTREAARLQSFPDWFEFQGSHYEQCEQIANAVSPLLSFAIARQVQKQLEKARQGKINFDRIKQHSLQALAIMSNKDAQQQKIEQSLTILRSIGIPVRDMTPRRRERVALALLAVARIRPEMSWSQASSYLSGDSEVTPITTRQIIEFWNQYYGQNLSSSSYDDVRRKDLTYLVESGLVMQSAANPNADTNDGTRGYAIHADGIRLLRAYGAENWEDELLRFRDRMGVLSDRLSRSRQFNMIPVSLPSGELLRFSPGSHNRIQKAVVEEFLPRFANHAEILYIGDTDKKILFIDEDRLREIGLPEISRNILPDIVAYEQERNWLFLIEAVHSSNPINQMRHMKLQELTQSCSAGAIYVSAFESFKKFSRFSKEISWETEVWIVDNPDHIIHYDGERFLGPHK